ncbi:MAG: hypothetical protein AB1505_07855 [Candidatus Latescibacterota bacterium]
MSLHAVVEIEEPLYTFAPANNGAGPLWCHGSTVLARQGDEVFFAGLETLPDQVPLNNCRWVLHRRGPRGWEEVHRDATGRTREPSPVALLGNGALLVSANPTLTAPGTYGGAARPAVFRFAAGDAAAPPVGEVPAWQGEPAFTEHSYRSLAADRWRSEVLYLQNVGYDVAHLSFRQADGGWQGLGTLRWPWGGEYDPPRPLRLCYPNVVLRERAAHFLGVGDIVEPVGAWKEAKFAVTQREWDYVFRRLFYAWTPDVTGQPFGEWLEIANRDATAGATANGDIHVGADGRVHLIWCETNTDLRLRDRFFPGQRLSQALEYACLRQGQVQERRTLARWEEGEDGLQPQLARFHVQGDGTPLVLASFGRPGKAGAPLLFRLAALESGPPPAWADVSFAHPMPGTFLTSTVRGGSAPGATIDMVGSWPDQAHTIGYARLRVEG